MRSGAVAGRFNSIIMDDRGMNERRVVITGCGTLSCVGNSVAETWDALVNGRCGLDKVTRFDASEYRTQIGGEIRDFDVAVVAEQDVRWRHISVNEMDGDAVVVAAMMRVFEAIQDVDGDEDRFRDGDGIIVGVRVV